MADRRLDGLVAVVTGSSRGIGEAIARRLGMAGATVVVTARTEQVRDERLPGTIHTVAEAIEKAGGRALAVPGNIVDPADRERLIATVEETLGPVDILVNNAAVLFPGDTIGFPEKRYDLMFNILVKTPFELVQRVLPGMIERQRGSILNISSRAAIHPSGPPFQSRGGPVYGMCKAALERLTTGVAAEAYEHGVSVNALSPNKVVATPGQMYVRPYTPEMIAAAEPVEVMAEAAYLLVSGDPKVLTGRIAYSQDLLGEFKREASALA